MGFSLKGAITGALTGGASGGWAGAGIGAAAGGFLGGDDDEMSAMDIYRMQRADALSDWNRQNAYNNPVAQMQRLKQANLNPYLVYSGGNVTGNSSSTIGQVAYKPQTVDSSSSALTKVLQNLNLRSMKADTKGKEVDTEMRELDLQLKKARLAGLISGRDKGSNKQPSPNSRISASRNEIKLANELYEAEHPAFGNAENANLLGFKPGKWSSNLVEWLSNKYFNARLNYERNATGYLRYFK